MEVKRGRPTGYAIFMTVLVILLILAIALFVYGSMTNGLPQPRLPGMNVFAQGRYLRHG